MPDITTLLAKFLNDLYAGTLGVTNAIASVATGDGTALLPAYTFLTQTSFGWYRRAASRVDLADNNVNILDLGLAGVTLNSSTPLAWTSGDASLAQDTTVSRVSAGVVKVANATAATPAETQVSGGSGGFISTVKALTELTTIAAAATTATTIQIPANAVVLGVSVRVVTIIPTAATFTVTSATPTKTWNTAAVAVAAGSTDPGTLGAPSFQTTASVITITPNLTPGAATGQVRVTIFYYTITPPTS